MSQNSLVQLVETREIIDLESATSAAEDIYGDYSLHLPIAEDLIRLSYAARMKFIPPTNEILNEKVLENLVNRRYISDSLGSLASRMTLRGVMTQNMIVPEIDGVSFSGYIQEPFVGRPILGMLYSRIIGNPDHNRTLKDQSYDPLQYSFI